MNRFITRSGCSASGAATVHVAVKDGSQVLSGTHVSSAHADADLAIPLERAQSFLHSGQDVLDRGDVVRSAPMGT